MPHKDSEVTATNPKGINYETTTRGRMLPPKEVKRQKIALLEKVASGEIKPKKAYEMLKEIF